ncbi:MAG: metallophosphoesterase family protein [Verrucomicrobiia bacterium]
MLIISDVHGNWPALRAVLEAESKFTQILCLGDLVNYGPMPVECVAWARDAFSSGVFLQGNHDCALGVDNRVANFVASNVASRVANKLANVRAFNFRLRVNRLSIIWLAAHRQGSFALLPFDFHLDDARFAKDRMAIKTSRGKCHGYWLKHQCIKSAIR